MLSSNLLEVPRCIFLLGVRSMAPFIACEAAPAAPLRTGDGEMVGWCGARWMSEIGDSNGRNDVAETDDCRTAVLLRAAFDSRSHCTMAAVLRRYSGGTPAAKRGRAWQDAVERGRMRQDVSRLLIPEAPREHGGFRGIFFEHLTGFLTRLFPIPARRWCVDDWVELVVVLDGTQEHLGVEQTKGIRVAGGTFVRLARGHGNGQSCSICGVGRKKLS